MKRFFKYLSAFILFAAMAVALRLTFILAFSNDPYFLIRVGYTELHYLKGKTAGEAFNKALRICQEIHDKQCEAESYFQIARLKTYDDQKILKSPYGDVIKNIDIDFAFNQAAKLYKEQNQPMNVAAVAFEHATYHADKNKEVRCQKYKEMREYYKKALAQNDSIKGERMGGNNSYFAKIATDRFEKQFCE